MSNTSEYLLVATYALVIPVYVWLLARVTSRKVLRHAEQYFYRGVLSILDNTPERHELPAQVSMLYRRLTEKMPILGRSFRSPIELLEELVVRIDTLEDSRFKDFYKMDRPSSSRGRILDCLNALKAATPFSLLSSKGANLLQTMLGALGSGNRELGEKTVGQLAEELEILEGKMRTDAKRTVTSYIATIVSTILTIFFGILSLLPLIAGKAA
jgi:hypothetical protein